MAQTTRWQPSVEYVGNRISVKMLSHPKHVSQFYYAMHDIATKRGYQSVYLDFSQTEPIFSNAAVPICAAIEYYKENGVSIVVEDTNEFVDITKVLSPLDADDAGINRTNEPLSKVWKFSSTQGICALTEAFVESLSEKTTCEKGVLESFEWCINEIMDNVLQHSQLQVGYVMGQLHLKNKHLGICVADYGIGLYPSLKNSRHKPRTVADAISLAIQEGVTRDEKIGQGNGLWGLSEIIAHNNGRLTITSGPASLFHSKGNVQTFEDLPYLSRNNHGAIVDFQMNLDEEIDISSALKYKHISLRVEKYEQNSGVLLLKIREEAHGTGTRRSAECLRNKISNIIVESGSSVELDFSGIGIVSSSFADELIGKMIVSLGFFNFQDRIKLKNMSATVQGIVQKAIAQRMSQSIS